jgi:SSS family solute:Na+ symporter
MSSKISAPTNRRSRLDLAVTTLDYLIVLVLNGGVIVYGLVMARGTVTGNEWFLGSRALPWWAIGLSMFATNVDSADLIAVSGNAYQEGIHLITVYTLGTVIGIIVAAFGVVPIIYRAGCYTNSEYLEARFGRFTRVASALIQIQYRTIILGLMIWSFYLLLTRLMGLPQYWAWLVVVGVAAFAAVYTSWGGLKVVVFTDAAQGLIMMGGAAVIFFTTWQAVGGWEGMTDKLSAASNNSEQLGDLAHLGRFHGSDGRSSPLVVICGWAIVASGYWTVNHTQTMRLMGARSLWDMKIAALLGATLSMPVMVCVVSLGLFGRALMPGMEHPDQLYPALAEQYLGPGLKGLVVAGVVAAAISTFDSMGSALSAVFTRDVYAVFISRDREDAHYLVVTRWATVVILALGFAYLPFIWSKSTMLEAFQTLIPVFVTPLLVIYAVGAFTSAHAHSGLVGLVSGGFYGIVALVDREVYDTVWLPHWFTGKWEAYSWSLFFTCLAMGITTLWCGAERRSRGVQTKTDATRGWLERSREEIPALLDHPFSKTVPTALSPSLLAAILLVFTSYLVFECFW